MDYDFSKYTEVDFNGTPISEVYLDGSLVWFKAKLLDFTFSGSNITGYKGNDSSITTPSSYSTITDSSGNTYYIEGNDVSVTGINPSAFSNNSKITSVTVSSGITSIGNSAFQGCTNLTTITLPSTLKTIGQNCFRSSPKLSTVTLNETPTSIGAYAFAGTNLSSLSRQMYLCPSLGPGCFAFLNPWGLSTTSRDVAFNLISTNSSISGTYSQVYGGSILGGGARQTGGDNSVSGSGTVNFRVGNYGSSFTVNMGSDYLFTFPTYRVQTETTNLKIGYTSRTLNFTNDDGTGGIYMGTSVNDRSNSSAVEDLTAGTLKERYLNFGICGTCVVEGTNITLANGSHKKVEDLNYDDLLRVWNLETGQFDIQYPLAIVKGEKRSIKFRLTIEDGSHLEICGQHDIFDPVAHQFRTYGEGAINSLDGDYYVMKDNGSNIYSSMKIISIDAINETVTAYGIITSGIITAFANDMMIGLGVLNLVPITEENKFSEIFENLKKTCYTYDKLVTEIYSDVEKDLAIGLNLLMTDIYHKDASGLPNLISPFRKRKPLPTCNGKKIHNLTFDDGKLTTIKSLEDEAIILPEIKTLGKNKWYIVGEYKYLEPGDTYITKFSTVIKAV